MQSEAELQIRIRFFQKVGSRPRFSQIQLIQFFLPKNLEHLNVSENFYQ